MSRPTPSSILLTRASPTLAALSTRLLYFHFDRGALRFGSCLASPLLRCRVAADAH
jgi:hypothetical protein